MMNKTDSKKTLTFVLGGGGSRGALQIGAIRALIEAGLVPDLLVGTSIGAVNAAGLALWGCNPQGLAMLEKAWKGVAEMQILDPRVPHLVLRSLIGHPSQRSRQKVEEYFTSLGITPDLRIEDLSGARLGMVSADIETGQPVIYGKDPRDPILEGMLASITLPPWFVPSKKDGQLIVDGGAVSNLPIEPALQLGATDIIALDLDMEIKADDNAVPLPKYFEKLVFAVSQRYIQLETSLAEEQGVPVHCFSFRDIDTLPTWDFSNTADLVEAGYRKIQSELAAKGGLSGAEIFSQNISAEDQSSQKIHPAG
jgi:NTE family protein